MPDPEQVRIAPQPRELALGILAGAELDLVDGLLARGLAVQVGKRLLIPDGLHGRHIARKPGSEQRAHFVEKPCLHHFVNARVDGALHVLAILVGKADAHGIVARRDELRLGVVLRHGFSGLIIDLERAENALFVVQMQLFGRFRVDAAKLLNHRLAALFFPAAFQLRAAFSVLVAAGKAVPGEQGI